MSEDSKTSPSQPHIEEQVQALLAYLINEKNLSERQIASLAGVSQSYVNKIKNGRASFKSLNAIYEILKGVEALPRGESGGKVAPSFTFRVTVEVE